MATANWDSELERQIRELQQLAKAKANTQAASLGQWNPQTGLNTNAASLQQAYIKAGQQGISAQQWSGIYQNTTATQPTTKARTKDVRSISACIRQINNLLHTIKSMKGQPIEIA